MLSTALNLNVSVYSKLNTYLQFLTNMVDVNSQPHKHQIKEKNNNSSKDQQLNPKAFHSAVNMPQSKVNICANTLHCLQPNVATQIL